MTSLRPWLVPTLAGPFVTLWGTTTVLFLLFGSTQIFGDRLDGWATAMLLTGFVAAGQVVSLLAADLALLALRVRRLPLGGRAWASSLSSPLFLYALFFFPPPVESIAGLAAWVGACMLGAATGARIIMGTRPSATNGA